MCAINVMAQRDPERSLKEELTCPICYELFTEPVMLDCMHHFCKSCIEQFWKNCSSRPSCPQCRREFPSKTFRTNFLVAGVLEAVKKTSTVEYKQNVQKQLQDTLKSHNSLKQKISHQMLQDTQEISAIKKMCEDLRQKVHSDFQCLHGILHQEERVVLTQLAQDEVRALNDLQRHLCQLTERISELDQSIRDIHKAMEDIKSTLIVQIPRCDTRSFFPATEKPQMCSLSSEAYTGPLQFFIWKKMLKLIRPVPVPLTFDPETVHPSLILSQDQTAVMQISEDRHVKQNPKRFEMSVNVLSTDGFINGSHYWEVWVGKKTKWDIGVARESVNRKIKVRLTPEDGYWTLRLRNGNDYVAATSPWTSLTLRNNPRKIGVFLDYEAGRVSFYDTDGGHHLFTFYDTFSERLYPFFSTCFSDGGRNAEPLRLCHLNLETHKVIV